jgi:hypothetical protein
MKTFDFTSLPRASTGSVAIDKLHVGAGSKLAPAQQARTTRLRYNARISNVVRLM